MPEIAPLEKTRLCYKPVLPSVLKSSVGLKKNLPVSTVAGDQAIAIQALFPKTYGQPEVSLVKGGQRIPSRPLKVGVVFSGGQAPGGHNVISGLFDGLKRLHPKSQLYGFLGGPAGITGNHKLKIKAGLLKRYRNTGGFDMLGSGRTKLENEEQFQACEKNLKALGITALVVVGGDDSNTNAAVLAEYFLARGNGISVLGVPKTIDGDLKSKQIETSFGFDTATKLYAELVGNVARDCLSAKKYWHFIKLMGRSASHIALECALQTHPNVCLISEEVAARGMTLDQVTEAIAEVVASRAVNGKNYGLVLIPEGLVEFIPEIKALISDLTEIIGRDVQAFQALPGARERRQYISEKLAEGSRSAFESLPLDIRNQLLADRDPHGNVQVSRIETEKLLMETVAAKLAQWKQQGRSKAKFSPLAHFFGYEGRACPPSNFDANYCYALGHTAACLAMAGLTGYMASVRGLLKPSSQWNAGGVPLTLLLNLERRDGKNKPVIKKTLVDLQGGPFKYFVSQLKRWAMEDSYLFPGSIQYWGPKGICNAVTETLKLERPGSPRRYPRRRGDGYVM